MKLKDSWIHGNGKLILGYVGTVDKSTLLTIQQEEITGALWRRVEDIAIGKVVVRCYKDFILEQATV